MNVTVKLEAFEGPLNLLYHLIEKNEINIYDIPIADITQQYLEILSTMEHKNMENMSEFLVMAASLIEIKSRMLLPINKKENPEEDIDPREELVHKLLEYKKFKKISEELKDREVEAEKIYFKPSGLSAFEFIQDTEFHDLETLFEGISLKDIFIAFQEVMKRQDRKTDKVRSGFSSIQRDLYTIDEKSEYILNLLILLPAVKFHEIFRQESDKMEIVVSFLALLELIKIKKICICQKNVFDDILIMKYNERDAYEADGIGSDY